MLRFVVLVLTVVIAVKGNVVPSVLPFYEPTAIVPQVDGRIIGGYDAPIQDHPYQLSLQVYTSHYCGAVLISAEWGLTARHCTIRYTVDLYSVLAGSSLANTGGSRSAITRFIDHPQYNSSTYDYDISLIQFQTPFTPDGVSIQTVPLATSFPAVGATAYVSGWGYLVVGGTVVNQLQGLKVPIVSMTTCRSSYGQTRITDRMICAGFSAGGQDACNGDSGGPLVVKGELVGLVSWGRSCAVANYPGVYTSIPFFREWVRENSGV